MKTSLLVLVALVASGCGLPRIAAHPYVTPRPPRAAVELCWLETGGTTAPGGMGTAGLTRIRRWEVTSSALLVRHPAGDFLIDTGMTPYAEEESRELTAFSRFLFYQTAGRNAVSARLPDLLREAGSVRLSGILVSHSHPDHMGGISLLPGVPVWMPAEEADFVRRHARGSVAVLPAQARSLEGRLQTIRFRSGPYANFDQSWDVFDDGTLVVVPTPGHTPGSVSIFVNLGRRRLVHVGDIINLQESVDRAVPKSFPMRTVTDDDEPQTEREVAKLVQLHELDPALWILPAHDRVAWRAFFGEPTHAVACVKSEP